MSAFNLADHRPSDDEPDWICACGHDYMDDEDDQIECALCDDNGRVFVLKVGLVRCPACKESGSAKRHRRHLRNLIDDLSDEDRKAAIQALRDSMTEEVR